VWSFEESLSPDCPCPYRPPAVSPRPGERIYLNISRHGNTKKLKRPLFFMASTVENSLFNAIIQLLIELKMNLCVFIPFSYPFRQTITFSIRPGCFEFTFAASR
jgi:hypothetical protein